jgi:ubiquinone biosynthesis protein UbiJ
VEPAAHAGSPDALATLAADVAALRAEVARLGERVRALESKTI